MTTDIGQAPMSTSSLSALPSSATPTDRLPIEIQDHIFSLLLQDDARQTCAAITRLDKMHHARYTPLLWHTVILDKHSAKHFGAFIERDVRKWIKRIVFAEPPAQVAGSASAWGLDREEEGDVQDEDKDKTGREARMQVPGGGKENGKGEGPGEGSDDMAWFHPCTGAIRYGDLFPSIEQIILTRSFTLALVMYISAHGGIRNVNGLRMDMLAQPILPKWAVLARELILESGPRHSVFWDLDFPFTSDDRLALGPAATESQYSQIATTGSLRGTMLCLLGASDIRPDDDFVHGDLSHLGTLTLWNYQILQSFPMTLYTDILHVVVSPHILKHNSHIASHIGAQHSCTALEMTFEQILEANADKMLVQGLPGLDDDEVAQAAEELVFGDCRGGERTYDRVIERVRYGPRDHALDFMEAMFAMPGDCKSPLDWTAYETPGFPVPQLELETDRGDSAAEDGQIGLKMTEDKAEYEQGLYDVHTLDWLYEPHEYQLGPDADPGMSFWEWQKDDAYEYEDVDEDMDVDMDEGEDEDEVEDEDEADDEDEDGDASQ